MAEEVLDDPPVQMTEADVSAALEEWWASEKEDADLPGEEAATSDIMKPEVEIDSHRAVRALVAIEEMVKVKVPESAIKEGGYADFEEMKADLTPKVMKIHEKLRKKADA